MDQEKTVLGSPSMKDQVKAEIAATERKLSETLDGFSYNRGPVNDAIKIVIPMMQDQLALLRRMVELIP